MNGQRQIRTLLAGEYMTSQFDPDTGDSDSQAWLAALTQIPSTIFQPFSLSATALVVAVFLGILYRQLTAVIALGLSVLLLIIGIIATPRAAVGQTSGQFAV